MSAMISAPASPFSMSRPRAARSSGSYLSSRSVPPLLRALPTQPSGTTGPAVFPSISAGDKHAMQTFVCPPQRAGLPVSSSALSRTGEDLVSEVFLDVWRQAGRFEADPRSRPGFWRLPAIRPCRHCSAGRPRACMKMVLPLRHDAFESHLAGVGEDGRAVAFHVLVESAGQGQ